MKFKVLFLTLPLLCAGSVLAATQAPYLEPGSLRLSHVLSLENVLSAPRDNAQVLEDGLDKTFVNNGQGNNAWKSEWGESLLTDVAARFSKTIDARALFNVQGDYADRLWRPINIDHFEDQRNNHVYLHEAEAKIKEENWYLDGFSGVARAGWDTKGDLFQFYKGIYPQRDYLGSSGYMGVYPASWHQNQYENISKRRVPQGAELGGNWGAYEGAVAYGKELDWGFEDNVYARLTSQLGPNYLTFVYKNEDTPYRIDTDDPERDQAFSLNWHHPSEEGWDVQTGVLYEPYRVGDPYFAGDSSVTIKEVEHSDGLGARFVLDGNIPLGEEEKLKTALNVEHLGRVAGNKDEASARLGADFGSYLQGFIKYTYRRPVEEAIPLRYEGTPDNMLGIISTPRGPESPFHVDWTNREAVFLTTTFNLDLTPGTNAFLYDPTELGTWNLNKEEDAALVLSMQHRMSDYKSTTDRQYYYDKEGNIQWEPAGHSGAWPSKHPLHEFRVLAMGNRPKMKWTVGFAGGQAPAISGLAYSTSTAVNKPVTEYWSLEGRLDFRKWAAWAHYGSGVWGPEENIHPYFGLTYDRLFGLGVSYNITLQTTVDVSYIGTRQDDNLFRAPGLGSFDEIRTVFSHRFGFLFMFENPLPPGTNVQ